MRLDELGNSCPATLGEYRDACVELGGDQCEAVKLLDVKIASQGEDEPVAVSDLEMRPLQYPMSMDSTTNPDSQWCARLPIILQTPAYTIYKGATALASLDRSYIESVYFGKPGCMCGCIGKRSSTKSNITRVLNVMKANAADVTYTVIGSRSFFSLDLEKRTYTMDLV